MTKCNCEYCEECSICGHKSDEHLSGDGQCFKCECPSFHGKMIKPLVKFGFISPKWLDVVKK